MSRFVRRNQRPDLTGRTLLLHQGDVDCLAAGELGSLTVEGVFLDDVPGMVLICGYWRGPDKVRELKLVRVSASVLPIRSTRPVVAWVAVGTSCGRVTGDGGL